VKSTDRRQETFQAPDTLAVHGGGRPEPGSASALSEPIYQTSVFSFSSLDHMNSVWEGRDHGYIYSRVGNPNVNSLAQAVASLEGGSESLVTSSGMAAIFCVLMACLEPGQGMVAARDIYGGTHALLTNDLVGLGIGCRFVDIMDPEAVNHALSPQTKVLYVETISNPLLRVAPLEDLAAAAQRVGAVLVVDNTFASPYLCRPLEWGADVVLHSTTKYLSGHGLTIGGAAVGREDVMERARGLAVRMGCTADPFAAWLTRLGMKTLALRMRRHSDNAREVAGWLRGQPGVREVFYPSLVGPPQSELVHRYLPAGAGGMLSFRLVGGRREANDFIRLLKMIELAPSLGDVHTTVSHPGLTSHRDLSEEGKAEAGIDDALIRLSVGIEDIRDIKRDLARALVGVGRGE